jgi:hypothetical protein
MPNILSNLIVFQLHDSSHDYQGDRKQGESIEFISLMNVKVTIRKRFGTESAHLQDQENSKAGVKSNDNK